ncbi:sporulation protein YqfD [Ferviditalea candida]|uniref:Sporulation protein YqfD n=1 Tax=Ferviditalea candida TaxID=3108399 RepID=A0ABU5ZDV7_9BACL|nr:sporulation protein YqfD [Paenibacillaceae bacterium T2]
MQESKSVLSIRGYVEAQVRGGNLEALLNRMAELKLTFWNVRRVGTQRALLYIVIKDFFRLRPLLKETGCRIHVSRRFGFPFWLDKLEQRKFFAAGFALFVIGLYLLSSVVWQVTVEGNKKIPTEDILAAAKREGIYPLQWKFRLQYQNVLSEKLHSLLPEAAWVGVTVEGTHVNIKVVESKQPEKKQLLSPRHLVSTADAVITDIFVEQGQGMVKPNMRVKKGDVLISGILGNEENRKVVVAKGKVRGLVWHQYNIEVPLIQKVKVYTGESRERDYLVLGNRALQVWGFGKTGFNKYETIPTLNKLQWRGINLPFGWLREKVMDVEYVENRMSREESEQIGLQQARADILMKSGYDSRIENQKILHEKLEDGKVYMTVLFEVDEDISKEYPLIQGE